MYLVDAMVAITSPPLTHGPIHAFNVPSQKSLSFPLKARRRRNIVDTFFATSEEKAFLLSASGAGSAFASSLSCETAAVTTPSAAGVPDDCRTRRYSSEEGIVCTLPDAAAKDAVRGECQAAPEAAAGIDARSLVAVAVAVAAAAGAGSPAAVAATDAAEIAAVADAAETAAVAATDAVEIAAVAAAAADTGQFPAVTAADAGRIVAVAVAVTDAGSFPAAAPTDAKRLAALAGFDVATLSTVVLVVPGLLAAAWAARRAGALNESGESPEKGGPHEKRIGVQKLNGSDQVKGRMERNGGLQQETASLPSSNSGDGGRACAGGVIVEAAEDEAEADHERRSFRRSIADSSGDDPPSTAIGHSTGALGLRALDPSCTSLALEEEPLAAWPHGDTPLWELEDPRPDETVPVGASTFGPWEGSRTGDKVSGYSRSDCLPRRLLPLEGLSTEPSIV
ncbi:hypothetical protein M440DRAFT_20166 [Trichoderma longibrachiatum ATCC 18648]|uniref:Uncharacterized protein n=1 Tax=Trichoderma longibrachiatum ATCC 18648 TaxID=983965 RepID=A0A2T4C329_TRILO|nr:hypothetical protein M440DRAFT_20166 [Trichoderma longibrachiatum ATCC 18648]